MASEEQLSDVLSEFAHTLVTDFPIQAILDHLVQRIVGVLPITAAGVTLIAPGTDPRYVAASDESALRYEELQTELGEGPCVETYRTGEAVAVADLRDEQRFPNFSRRALEAGLGAVFTFPLRNGDEQLGALDLYRDTPGPMDAATMRAAQTLADVAAAYLLNAKARNDLRDSTERHREQAMHDPLTGLPNRALLLERLEHAKLRGRRSGQVTAVLFADLDQFKAVNDLHGHGVGDQLLVAVAQRLTAVLRPGDTLARMSGDEFVIFCEDLDSSSQVEAIAARVGASVAAPFDLSGVEVGVTASVGIAFWNGQSADQLLSDADTAMYQAKRKGGDRQQVVDRPDQQRAAERAGLQRDLRGAAGRDELRTEYQPILDIAAGRVVAVEALVRWVHPDRGVVTPAVFVPLAEETEQISEIGRWVLERACRDRHEWRERRPADELRLSVNVSAQELLTRDYAETVAAVLSRTGTDPGLVTLAVAENVFQDGDRALAVLRALKGVGVTLALDDFGAGPTSLYSLARFPIDVVKIDRTVIAGLVHDQGSHAIVLAVVELAHILGMVVVAEGVETAEQHRRLAALRCDRGQGPYFARPMGADDIAAWMAELVVLDARPPVPPEVPVFAGIVAEGLPASASARRNGPIPA
jgi:diguanylate cyclase (GGDEF)-like protein